MKNLLLLFFVFIHFLGISQFKEKKKLQLQSLSIQTGYHFNENIDNDLSNFRKLAPNSKLLENDFSKFRSSTYNYEQETFSNAIYAHFNFKDNENESTFLHPSFKFGIVYSSSNLLNINYFRSEFFRVDTLVSTRTGNSTFVDSISSQNIDMNYYQSQLFFDASILFSSNPKARWTIYGGFNIGLGFNFSNTTSIYYYRNNYDFQNFNNSRYDFDSSEETFRNKNSFSFITGIPVGLDFRMGNLRKNWMKSHVFLEFRPSIYFTSVPELNNIVHSTTQTFFGFRYELR